MRPLAPPGGGLRADAAGILAGDLAPAWHSVASTRTIRAELSPSERDVSMDTVGELDIEDHAALLDYLRQKGLLSVHEEPVMRTLQGGVSNRTVLVQRPAGEAWVLKQALPKLRVAVDWYSSPARIQREALGLQWLSRLVARQAITSLVFLDTDHNLLAMRAVPEPHANWKSMLLEGRIERDHAAQFGSLLGTIHGRGYHERDAIASEFDDRTFFESLRIEPYYSYTAGQVADAAGFLHDLIDDTRRTRLTLTHGDYSPKNILVYDNHLILLDHEVIHFGDPAFDLGFGLTHLLSKAHHVAGHRAEFREAALLFWQNYCHALGDVPWLQGLEERAVRQTLGCLLARVSGRSPLEYLTEAERARQRLAATSLMRHPPGTVPELVDSFMALV
ncbi:MAG TPA: phosphotransferase [Chloroflexota bacterium]|nr:phosphotransferase [Chloroflexota bacterium]